jgi:hypothetical protein
MSRHDQSVIRKEIIPDLSFQFGANNDIDVSISDASSSTIKSTRYSDCEPSEASRMETYDCSNVDERVLFIYLVTHVLAFVPSQ